MNLGVPELVVLIAIGLVIRLLIRAIRRRGRGSFVSNVPAQPASQEQSTPELPGPAVESASRVSVELLPEERRLSVATEVVRAPRGVIIKVSRSRTVEHSVAVSWRREIGTEIGFQQFIKASIREELERRLGRTYQETETIAYEVELNGRDPSGTS